MNKYQEAMKIYSCLEYENTVGNFTPLDYQKARLTLQELVDLATPKKPIKDEPSKIRYMLTYACPICGQHFSGMISNFCYHCGQKLDWSDY